MNKNNRADRIIRMRMGTAAKRFGVPIDCVCPKCFQLLKPKYENNGFDEPDQSKIEVNYLFCPDCGYKE